MAITGNDYKPKRHIFKPDVKYRKGCHINKELRLKIFNKYGGRCSYCGCEITIKSFQVDHYWPLHLRHHQPEFDPNREENLMPSCRKCNLFKHGYRPEAFRKQLQKQVESLRKNAQFNRALRFSQIQITESPIVFYFEKELTNE